MNSVKEDLPVLNTELLSQIVTWAYADELKLQETLDKYFEGWGSWNQMEWAYSKRNGVCQTAYCMAGQTVIQSGFAIDYNFEPILKFNVGTLEYEETGYEEASASLCYPAEVIGVDEKNNPIYRATGRSVSIETTAKNILGLTSQEAYAFFDGDNHIERIVTFAMYFAKMRGVSLNLSEDIASMYDVNEIEDVLIYEDTDDGLYYEYNVVSQSETV